MQKEGEKVGIPRARCRTTLGIELRADSGWSGSALEKISVGRFRVHSSERETNRERWRGSLQLSQLPQAS